MADLSAPFMLLGFRIRTDNKDLAVAVSLGTNTKVLNERWPGLVKALSELLPDEKKKRERADRRHWDVDWIEHVGNTLTVYLKRDTDPVEPIKLTVPSK